MLSFLTFGSCLFGLSQVGPGPSVVCSGVAQTLFQEHLPSNRKHTGKGVLVLIGAHVLPFLPLLSNPMEENETLLGNSKPTILFKK